MEVKFYKAFRLFLKMNTLFSVDVEPDLNNNSYSSLKKGLPKLIQLLGKHNIKATFFVTCDCIEKYPDLFKKLQKQGHEIALHGYRHERFDILSYEEKEDRIKRSLACFRKYLKTKPIGFRAPQHSIDNQTFLLLKKYGFKYDSSRTPGNAMLLRHLLKLRSSKKEVLKNLFSSFKPYQIVPGLVEIPRSSFIISLGGFEIKAYPRNYYRLLLPFYKLLGLSPLFVMHSWDMIHITGSRTSKLCSPEEFEVKLDKYLSYVSNKAKFLTLKEFHEKNKNS